MILKKSTAARALVGTFAPGDQLHSDVYRIGVQESLAGNESSFSGVGIIRKQAGESYCACGCFGPVQSNI
jgi:hypothetical protein